MKLKKRTGKAIKRVLSLSLAMCLMGDAIPTQTFAAPRPTISEISEGNAQLPAVVDLENQAQREEMFAKLASAPFGTEFYARIRYGDEQSIDIPADRLHSNKVQAILWTAGFAKGNQLFIFRSRGGGLYQIINMESGKILEAGGSEDCAPVVQNQYHTRPNGIWKIVQNENNTVSLMNLATKKYLNVRGGGDAPNSTPLIIYHDDSSQAKEFILQGVSRDELLCATGNRVVRICYAPDPNSVLDVPAQWLDKRNAPLQIWDKVFGHNQQHFDLYNTGSGWILVCHESGKYLEVCNSSNKPCAAIVQDDPSDSPYARWELLINLDGSVTLVNRGSGLRMNCCGGSTEPDNGVRVIQYWDDSSRADDFYVDVMDSNDVLSAVWVREITQSDIKWTAENGLSKIFNRTGWIQQGCYPAPGQKVLTRVDFLSPNTTLKMLKERAYQRSFWEDVKAVLNGEADEAIAAKLLEHLGIDDVPVLGGALGILHAVFEIHKNRENNNFVNAVNTDVNGKAAAVIIYTYEVVELTPSFAYDGYRNRLVYNITTRTEVQYASWNGENFGDVCTIPDSRAMGAWSYRFK